jgi:hypothetical protein
MNLARYPPGISNFGRFLASFFSWNRALDFLFDVADLLQGFFFFDALTVGISFDNCHNFKR